MTAKAFRFRMRGYMLPAVLAAGVLGARVPGVPTWAFLAGGLFLVFYLVLDRRDAA